MFEIQKRGDESIPLIRELTFQVWPQTYASILTTEQIDYMLNMIYSAESLKQQISKSGHQFIFAYENQEPIAFASYSPLPDEPAVVKVHKLYCLPKTQGKGIGKKLLEYIVADVKKPGVTQLEVNVNRHNPAKSFYEKLEFEVVREDDIDIGNGYFMNDYVLRKRI